MYKYSNNSLDRYIGSPKYQWEINNISYKCNLECQNKVYWI